jgi:hypothetical protein
MGVFKESSARLATLEPLILKLAAHSQRILTHFKKEVKILLACHEYCYCFLGAYVLVYVSINCFYLVLFVQFSDHYHF